MLTCVRTGFYGRTVPSAEGILESSPAAVRSDARPSRAAGRSSSSTDSMSEHGSVSASPTRRDSMDLCCR
eukprot:5434516-Prymnesium_polylepis.1